MNGNELCISRSTNGIKSRYSKKTRIKRTRVLGVQADFVLIYRVFSAKSA